MGRKRVAIIAVLILAATLGWWVLEYGPLAKPEVDEALAESVLPVVDDHLTKPDFQGMLTSSRPELGPRWFCTEDIIEIQPHETGLRVGLVAYCGEYARDGSALLTGSGWKAPVVVTLTGSAGQYVAQGSEQARDGAGYRPSVEKLFSPKGASAVLHGSMDFMADPAGKARSAFGLG